MATVQVSNTSNSPLKKSPSFRYGRKKSISRTATEIDDIINHLHGSDPVRFELNRLENQMRGTLFIMFLSLNIVVNCIILLIQQLKSQISF